MKEWDINIYRGILTGYNEAFIIDTETRDRLVAASPKNAEIIRPILRGRDIKKYKADWAGLYLINTHTGYKSQSGEIVPPINIKDYPAVKEHLDKYYTQLAVRQDKGITPYHLRSCIYMEDFSKQKIIFQEIVQESSFTFDSEGKYFCLDTARIITGQSLDILLAVLNSKIFFYSIKRFYGGGGLGETGIRMKHTFFENFPLPMIAENDIKEIELIMKNPLENDFKTIDKILYKSFLLDKNEIELIDFQ